MRRTFWFVGMVRQDGTMGVQTFYPVLEDCYRFAEKRLLSEYNRDWYYVGFRVQAVEESEAGTVTSPEWS